MHSDLLQRHYTVHGKDQNQEPLPAANGMIPKSAGRTPIACSNCAKTKTKCDKKFPCSRCAGRNLKCTLRPTRRATKGAVRAGVGPDGTVSLPAASMMEGAIQQPYQSESPPHQPPVLKPASPKTVSSTTTIDERPPPTIVDGPPSLMFDHPTSGPEISPGFPHQDMGFPLATPVASYEDLSSLSKDESDLPSPQFVVDWNSMPMPLAFDGSGIVQPHMLLNNDVGLDPTMLPLAPLPPASNRMLTILPDLANGAAPLMTPNGTPKVEQAFSNLGIHSAGSTRHPSRTPRHSLHVLSPEGDVRGEMAQIVAARDSWSVFRCNPTVPSSACPTTAKLNLERLEQTLRNHEGWSTWSPQWDEADFAGSDHLVVMQLHESTRDKLLAITQTFLHKALEIHSEVGTHSPEMSHHSPGAKPVSNFVLLPPARVLEYFLRSYANCSERYYPLTSRGSLDVNELMHCYNDKAASLLVLMMIAQGAMNIPSVEARMLTGGLTEACRISLFDLIEKNIIMSGDPIVLHAALLFTVLAAWSGDKWQMDIAMGQRGMYFAMLRHSGVLEYRGGVSPRVDSRGDNMDHLWNEWIQNESRSRLVYSWIMVDQEMALFHDTAPLFSVTEFATPMPDADHLWHAKSAGEWSQIFEQVHEFANGLSSVGSGARPLSLRDLFQHFLDDELQPMGIEMTPLQLRLLLHPLQGLVCQHAQLLSCFSSTTRTDRKPPGITSLSTRQRLTEVQALLGRWYELAERYLSTNPLCSMMSTNLVIFHLISLNAVTNFPHIESLARREALDGTYPTLLALHRRCIFDLEEAVYHCGQVLRLVRNMPRGVRPPWWAGAIYRIGLVLWTDSLVSHDALSPANNGMFPVAGPSFAIDALLPDHPLIVRYLTKREGVPCLTRRDGTQIGIERGVEILRHCVDVVDEGAATRFSDGVRAKLEVLARG